jgi:hypothetical protein
MTNSEIFLTPKLSINFYCKPVDNFVYILTLILQFPYMVEMLKHNELNGIVEIGNAKYDEIQQTTVGIGNKSLNILMDSKIRYSW